MKAVIFSDLQANNYRSYAHYRNGYNSRLVEIVGVLAQIREYMERNNINVFFFLGDFFDPRVKIDVEVLYLVGCELRLWSKFEGHFLLGNHDKYEESDEVHTNPLQIFAREGFNIVSDLACLYDNILMIPYRTSRDRFMADLAKIRKVYKRFDDYTLMVHQGIADMPLPNDRYVESNRKVSNLITTNDLKEFRQVFSGHWHGRRTKKNVCIVGSPLQFDFNDVGESRGFVVYDTDNHEYNFVDTKYKRFIDCSVGNKKELLDLLKKLPDMDAYPRIIMPEDLVSYLPKGRNFTIKTIPSLQQQNSRIELSSEWSFEELLAKYVKYCDKGEEYKEFGLRMLHEASKL